METLTQKINRLKKEDKAERAAKKNLPGLSVRTFLFNWKGEPTINVNIDLKETKLSKISETIQDILKAYPATKNASLSFAAKSDIKTGSPYKLRFKNPAKYNQQIADLEYRSGAHAISIEIPVSFYSDDIKEVFIRRVTDCEYHYFTGMDIKKILKIEVRCFKSSLFETAKYFGGDCITYLTSDCDQNERAEFETFVLNGHVPQFVAFWKQSLIDNDK